MSLLGLLIFECQEVIGKFRIRIGFSGQAIEFEVEFGLGLDLE